MKTNTIFSHLGMTDIEARVYKALLRMGPSPITVIMGRAKLHRPSTYRAIESLLKKNLLTVVPKGKRRLYAAASPTILKVQLQDNLERLATEVDALMSLYEKSPQKPMVRFIEGKQAIASAYLNIPGSLKKGDIFYRYSSRDVVNRKDQIDKRTIRRYQQERDAKQLERYVITSKANYELKKPKLERAIKMVPSDFDLFDHDVSQVIYGNTILLIDYNSDTAIQIENPIMAHFQKRIFELLYKLLPT